MAENNQAMIKIKHACATQDKDFIVSYERAGERYKPLPVDLTPPPPVSIKAGIRSLLRREAVSLERSSAIDLSELDAPSCPVCGADNWVTCGWCKAAVCDGKSRPGYFLCRKSCGASGATTRAFTCDATEGSSRPMLDGSASKRLGAPVIDPACVHLNVCHAAYRALR